MLPHGFVIESNQLIALSSKTDCLESPRFVASSNDPGLRIDWDSDFRVPLAPEEGDVMMDKFL